MKSLKLINTLKNLPLFIFMFCFQIIYAQKNCNNHTTGLIPITDLSGKTYRGYVGGKYTSGNNRPTLQLNRAISQAKKIEPLDTSGKIDKLKGKILFAAIGASNPATEFNQLITFTDTFKSLNPMLRLFNTCVGGTGIQKMNEFSDPYWTQANKKLLDSGYSNKQVQVVWVEQENTQNADTAFPSAALSLMEDYRKLLSVIYLRFPNVKIVYLNQRAFAGYVDATPGVIGKGLHFPRDYYNGWCIKWLIEKQLNDVPGFRYSGIPEIPFIDWAASFWADGKNPRSDGLSYDCNIDFGGDGLHLSAIGEKKAALILFNYFKTDSISKYWFYANSKSVAGGEILTKANLNLYPNPTYKEVNITGDNPIKISIHSINGQLFYQSSNFQTNYNIQLDNRPKGLYIVNCTNENGTHLIRKFAVQ